MGDYAYCERHDINFLMPELLMCPKCAYESLLSGHVPEPFGDALQEYIKTLRDLLRECQVKDCNSQYPLKLDHQKIDAALGGIRSPRKE